MASAIYGKDVEEISKDERFVGKTTILGAGYGMGAQKFQAQLKTFGVEITEDETIRIIQVYRSTYDKIPDLWKQAQRCLEAMVTKSGAPFSVVDAVQFDPMQNGFLLPSGLWQRYDGLEKVYDSEGKSQYQYKTRKGMVKIYGGKVVENLCQAVARCVIAEQMLLIAKKYKVVLTVHDAVACIAPEEEAEEAQQYVEQCMKTRPSWAQTLPLSCESGVGKSYGDC
jgi:DNA polymerase